MSYRKQQRYRTCRGRCGQRRRRFRKNGVRLPAVIIGTVLILILCGRVILTGGIGGITGQAAESQAVETAASPDTSSGQQDSRAARSHQLKNAQEQEWNLLLVNPWNPIPENYEPELTYLRNGQAVDSRCYPELQQMMDDCRAAGFDPLICASYRTMEKREALFEDKEARLIREGCPENEVEAEAAKVVAYPGTSEHQLGLALDIVDVSYQQLDTEQENTPVQQWLMKNSWKYGFVLRYPTDKSDITGIIYEPWHYRYVGKEAAAEMYENKLCLEEYLGIN
ncbi:M15 family metallopeptidase [Mediterraneibacter glycyrrhizinilyticus]|uniref:M15 family metallopeptidase n=1 Tax=Mediterraneibacter glycyrrhizinilyticus TaxID=342942 RepID=UPI0025AB0C20|nr:M15 family metallopeptidase [Mediterraneibacter glycyrrhizinilyticus]MDN0044458.1 M15 family metallopeptidase [Mediterraneibacter glycyrrhizinilyticus]